MGRSKGERTIRIVRPKDQYGLVVVCITIGKKVTHYVVREIRCDIGGRGFEMHRLGLGELYHMRVGDPDDYSCDCLGFLQHGHCKHVAALWALVRSRQL